ncbi:MAG: Trm112 family protein [Desulfurococcaceae archaeon]|uniref:Trm112 family protein n=1 Tax=Staphylothermus marinus TaxID=2280 RepID=A0A7C4D9A5_STAMA
MMRYWGIDYIKCIYCSNYPLKLIVLDYVKESIDTAGLEKPLCRNYCGYLNESIQKNKEYPCNECLSIGIREAVLYCDKCNRWYPVINGILQMLRDNKRKESVEKEFLKKWSDKLPKQIVYEGKPFNLSNI